MSSNPSSAINELVSRVTGDGRAPRGWEASLAECVQEASIANSSYLREFANDLVQEVQARIRNAEPEAREVATGTDAQCAPAIRQSFRLGQLSFAQMLAAQMLLTRTDSDFLAEVYQPKYQRYLLALAQQELTNSQLSSIVGESQEHVSRKLNVLRRLGITDFRRESKNTVNFLTVAAHDALLSMPVKKLRNKVHLGLDVAVLKRIFASGGKRTSIARHPPARHSPKIIGTAPHRSPEPNRIHASAQQNATAQERIWKSKLEEIANKLDERYRGTPTFATEQLSKTAA